MALDVQLTETKEQLAVGTDVPAAHLLRDKQRHSANQSCCQAKLPRRVHDV